MSEKDFPFCIIVHVHVLWNQHFVNFDKNLWWRVLCEFWLGRIGDRRGLLHRILHWRFDFGGRFWLGWLFLHHLDVYLHWWCHLILDGLEWFSVARLFDGRGLCVSCVGHGHVPWGVSHGAWETWKWRRLQSCDVFSCFQLISNAQWTWWRVFVLVYQLEHKDYSRRF